MPGRSGRRWPPKRVKDVPAAAGVYVLYNRTKRVAAGRSFNLRAALAGLSRAGAATFTSFDWELVRREEERQRRVARAAARDED